MNNTYLEQLNLKVNKLATTIYIDVHFYPDYNSNVKRYTPYELYTNKDIFLRELISNASDACNKLKYDAIKDPGLLAEDIDLKITVKIDKKKNTIIVVINSRKPIIVI